MPLTASSPIEPPGKRIGLTTNASVVMRELADARGVVERVDAEGRREQPLDQGQRRLAAGAVRHRQLRVAEARRPGAHALDEVERLLLAGVGRHHTTARSRATRPKL